MIEHGDGNALVRKQTEGVDMEKPRHSLVTIISPRNGNGSGNIDEDGERNDKFDGLLKSSDRESKSHAEKLAPIIGEKLWDGSLQLSSSVTVSAVAFFKSGEKKADLKWSEFLEVKGKVRLEAFEKYIQDLPRSRNRGLMVISLCCKEGSSKSGLGGMKEVAKGYKKGERVGVAQLSHGVDLYICPHSDTIITILAKNGFLKGMAAVEDNQDSMIGCIVWRRVQASSGSVIKRERESRSSSEQPFNASSVSSAQRVVEKNLSHSQPAQESIQVASRTDYRTVDGARINNGGTQNIEADLGQPELHNSSTIANMLLTSMSKGLQPFSVSDSASLLATVRQLLQVEAPLMNSLQEKPKPSFEVRRPALPWPSDFIKEPQTTPDDDLPEFDFGTACGDAPTPAIKMLNAAIIGKKLPSEDIKKISWSLPPTMPTVQAIPACSDKGLGGSGLQRPPPDSLQSMPLQKKVCKHDKTLLLPNFEERIARSSIPGGNIAAPLRNLFDDDDMPEWCPPNIQLYRQPVSETARASTTSISSKIPTSAFPRILPGPSPLPSPPAAYRPLSTEPEAFTGDFHCPMSRNVKTARPRPSGEHTQQGPNSLTGFNSSPLFRPPLKPPFDVKLPLRPAGRRGRGP